MAGTLAQLAHDMRTPVGSLGLWLRELRKECDAAGVGQGILPRTQDALVALSRLAEDMDDFARILRGTLRIHGRPVDLRLVLERIHERVRPRAEMRGADVRMDLGSEVVQVAGDPDRLDRAFDALVGSAVGSAGRGVVEVALRADLSEARVSIRPSPVGAAGLPRLQETLGVAGQGGMALSLSLARHLLEAHSAIVELGGNDLGVRLPLVRGR